MNKTVTTDKPKLRFTDHDFRILCVSDIHGGVGYDEAFTTDKLRNLLDKTNPDFVLLLGDIAGPGIIHIETAEQLRTMLKGLLKPLTDRNIPFAHVFGNHDDNYGLPNGEALQVYKEFPNCLSDNEDTLPGDSNYTVHIYDEGGQKILFAVYGFDSMRGTDAFRKQYHIPEDILLHPKKAANLDCGERGLDFAQVQWYVRESEKLEKSQGYTIPAMAVMHVPLQEMGIAAQNPDSCQLTGYQGEPVSCQGLNCGFLRACRERGDIKAICFGHDHENNISTQYAGILLENDGYLSAHASHTKETLGGRLYEIDRKNPEKITSAFVSAL